MGFGSLEAALTTTADVALQIALAGGLGRAGAGLQELLADFLERLYKSTKQSGRNVSKGVLTAMSVKIPITKLLKMAILHLKLLLLLELWLLLCGKLLNTLLIS
jgi:trans-2-enoyl-CoA reductase